MKILVVLFMRSVLREGITIAEICDTIYNIVFRFRDVLNKIILVHERATFLVV